jgi:NAD(P)-dependent dehydrogenase (short-subunit alcohol dehydrogenase family)
LESVDWRAWTDAIATNLYGSVLAIRALLPHFKARGYGKIIQLSGGGATNPLPRISAYAASKAAIVRLIETVAEECRSFGIDANSIAPGALNTGMLDEVLQAGPEAVGQKFFDQSLNQKATGGTDLLRAATLAVFLASHASDGITGRLISAVWDRYEEWPARRDEFAGSDVYTLRRITGRDRGFSWGDR